MNETWKARFLAVAQYFINRLHEPSTYRGLILFMSAGAWAKLDGASKGEFIMQMGLLLAGAIQVLVPQSMLYKVKE